MTELELEMKRLYKVKVPRICTVPEWEVEKFGIALDVIDDKIDKFSFENTVEVEMSIDRIVEIYSEGYKITISNTDDIIKMYNNVESYLSYFKDRYLYSVNNTNRPKFIDVIDEFLTEVFENNKYLLTKANTNTGGGFNLGINLMSSRKKAKSLISPVPNLNVFNSEIPSPDLSMDNIHRESVLPKKYPVNKNFKK